MDDHYPYLFHAATLAITRDMTHDATYFKVIWQTTDFLDNYLSFTLTVQTNLYAPTRLSLTSGIIENKVNTWVVA